MKKKFLLLSIMCLLASNYAYSNEAAITQKECLTTSDIVVFSENSNFGLKDKEGNVIVNPEYTKLVRVGKYAWIVQKKSKFGLIDCKGNFIAKPKYRHVERFLGSFAKLGNEHDYGLYNDKGELIIPHEYDRISLMFGRMFLTCKDYKYGVVDFNGNKLLENKFDDIYMPKPNVMRVEYNGKWYEIEQVSAETLTLPKDIKDVKKDDNFKISEIITNPVAATGYSAVTVTDYFLKIFSSISPAYEETIDDLMLSKGADTVTIFMRLGWIPKFPFTYARKYYNILKAPNNGPLSEIKKDIKNQL